MARYVVVNSGIDKSHGEHGVPEVPVTEDGHITAEDLPPSLGLGAQLVRFVLVGGVSAVVDYGILQILMQLVGVQYSLAKAISFVFGTLTAYALNRRYTFRAEPSWRRFLTTMAVYAVMFAVQWGLFTWVTAFLLGRGTSEFWASTIGYVVGQGVATVTNFVVQRALIFRD